VAASSSDRITLPGDLTEFARDCDRKLATADPHSGIVGLDSVPWLVVTHEQLRTMPLDQRHGFVLSLVDGRCTIEMLADISGFGRAETIALVAELVGHGALVLRPHVL
jgi:hypothetical protein